MNKDFLLNRLLLIILKVLAYTALFFLLESIARLFFPAINLFVVFAGTLTVIIIFQAEITASLQNIVSRVFYPRFDEFNREVTRFRQQLTSILESDQLQKTVNQFFHIIFRDMSFAYYVYSETAFELYLSSAKASRLPALLEPPENTPDLRLFDNAVRYFSLENAFTRFPDSRSLIEPFLEKYEYIIPLASYKGIIGLLLLGRAAGRFLRFPDSSGLFLGTMRKMADVIENVKIHTEVKRASLESELLLESARKMTASLNLKEVLNSIMDSLIRLVAYDAGGIFLVDHKSRRLQSMVTRGYDRDLLEKMQPKIYQGISGQVIRTKKAIIHPDVRRDKNYYRVRPQTRSQITVPIFAGEQVIGVFVLENDHINHFTPADLSLMTSFSSLAGIAINNAKLFEDSLKKQRMESELLVASRVQRALLPRRPPPVPGITISALSLPCFIVGGDVYDLFRIGENGLGVAIGDVSGKGAPGAILMAVLYAGFKSLLKDIYLVVEIVAQLNNLMSEATTEGYFATFFYGQLDVQKKEFTYCNAGHNPPILLRKNLTIEMLEKGGTVLGFLKDQTYRQEAVKVNTGDYLVFYTDGVTEAKNEKDEEFGEKRLVDTLKENYGKSPLEMKQEIFTQLESFAGNQEFPDDITLIIIKIG